MARRRFVPDSILGWLVLILLAGVIASQALTAVLHNANRNAAIITEQALHPNDFPIFGKIDDTDLLKDLDRGRRRALSRHTQAP